MRKKKWGRFVGISSNMVGLAIPGMSHYIATKMGIIGFMRGLANDVASDGITANAVLPGLTNTLATAPQSEEQKRSTWVQCRRRARQRADKRISRDTTAVKTWCRTRSFVHRPSSLIERRHVQDGGRVGHRQRRAVVRNRRADVKEVMVRLFGVQLAVQHVVESRLELQARISPDHLGDVIRVKASVGNAPDIVEHPELHH